MRFVSTGDNCGKPCLICKNGLSTDLVEGTYLQGCLNWFILLQNMKCRLKLNKNKENENGMALFEIGPC